MSDEEFIVKVRGLMPATWYKCPPVVYSQTMPIAKASQLYRPIEPRWRLGWVRDGDSFCVSVTGGKISLGVQVADGDSPSHVAKSLNDLISGYDAYGSGYDSDEFKMIFGDVSAMPPRGELR